MDSNQLRQTLIGIAIGAALTGGVVMVRTAQSPALPAAGETPVVQPAAPAPIPTAEAPAKTSAALADFAAIAADNGAAVVNISTRGPQAESMPEAEGPGAGDPFAPFFGPQESPEEQTPSQGMGSGFIVTPDGVVLTNAHVVDGASEVTVKLADRREFVAKVVGVDKLTDTAVLKIDAQNLPAVRIGNPAEARVGEWVLAIGSPFGFENTVTAGIISAKSRSLPEEGYVPFIQTDVAVNPGNSGGPLLNVKGEVIGINSQIYSRTGGYQGLAFAIPIDVALNVEQQLLKNGRVSRGKLGIAVQDLTQALAESFGLANPNGALVGMVPPDGPGAKAGLKPGDVILEMNGQPVRDSRELPPKVADLKPGSIAALKVWREGKMLDIPVTVAELEDSVAPTAGKPGEAAEPGRLGLAVRPLTAEEQRATQTQGGLRVEKATGPSAKAGIRRGDIVLAVNGVTVNDAAKLKELAQQAGKHLALLIKRGGDTLFVAVELD
jgi:serine protease Do